MGSHPLIYRVNLSNLNHRRLNDKSKDIQLTYSRAKRSRYVDTCIYLAVLQKLDR